MKAPLIDRVRQAYFNSIDNGYDFNGWNDLEVAVDMTSFSSSLKDDDVTEVAKAVEEVRRTYRNGQT